MQNEFDQAVDVADMEVGMFDNVDSPSDLEEALKAESQLMQNFIELIDEKLHPSSNPTPPVVDWLTNWRKDIESDKAATDEYLKDLNPGGETFKAAKLEAVVIGGLLATAQLYKEIGRGNKSALKEMARAWVGQLRVDLRAARTIAKVLRI